MTQKIRRQFSDEFKADAVRLVTEQGYRVSEAARNLDVSTGVLSRWIQEARDQGEQMPKGKQTTEQEEIRQLREQVRRLKMEREILKKAAAFFAKESS